MSEQEPKIESLNNNIPIGYTRQDSFPDSDKNKENNDQIAYDKKLWNLGEMPFPDLSLKKESESKLSIDVPDLSNQKLKEYLNEDLLDAIDVSPMTTPKNIMNLDNNEINLDNKDLFQFSLYNNNDEKENNIENEDNNEDKDENKNEINKIKEDEGGGNINILNNKNIEINIINENIINNIVNEKNNNEDNISNNENININNDNIIIENINKEINTNKDLDINKGKNNNNINNENNIIDDKEIHIIEKDKNINIVQEIKKDNENLEKIEIKENKEKNNNNPKKNFYQPQYQYQYPFIQFPYVTQPLMGSINSFGYENKFDTNKKYQVLVPFTVLKKNVKVKKPFEIREGDWTCSNCNNLNFSFRVKCNRCFISKEQSEQDKNKENKENKIKKEDKEQHKYPLNKNKTYYQNNNTNNTMQYKYYPGFIYVPIQAQFPKKEKK